MSDPEFPDRLSRDPATPTRRPRRGRSMIAGGVAAALALGALGGLIMRPQLDDGSGDRQRPVRDVELPGRPDDLTSLLPPLRPSPPPEFDPDEFEFDGEPLPEPEELEPPPEPEPEEEEPVAQPEPRRFDRVRPQPRPVPAPRVTVNCSGASSTAERLVCVDPRLRSMDREMAAAYGEALASGVPPAVLGRQQQVWLRARDAAAAHGPEDLAGVYNARIDELRSMTR